MKKVESIWAELSAKAQEVAQEVELSEEQKVELGKVEELDALLQKAKGVESDMVDAFMAAQANSRKGVKAGETHLQNLKEMSNLVSDIKTSADALGVDVNSIREWKSANNFLNQNPSSATNKMLERMKGLL